jgi:aminoglycoside phosphotransferase (APT) family kinase protein
MEVPDAAPEAIKRMCESMAEQIAAIHSVNVEASSLNSLGDGRDHLARELDHWTSEMRRVQRGPLPALERLLRGLTDNKPEPSAKTTLVHGDAKPGNFAFVGDEVSAVFDWELTTVGDPLTDIGYLELLWKMPVGIPSHPAALSVDELLAHYESVSGNTTRNREWYRALNAFKLAVINLIGSKLFDDGATDDQRFVMNAYGIPLFTQLGLADLGIDEQLEDGPILPREERVQEAQSKAAVGH